MKRKNFFAIIIAITTILITLPFNKSPVSAKTQEGKLNIQNTVVFLTFDEQSSFEEDFDQTIYKMYESSSVSVKNYLLKQSRGKVELSTQIIKGKDGAFFVQSSNPVEYYKPRYEWHIYQYNEVNPEGYDNRYFNSYGEPVAPQTVGAKVHIDASYREQLLLTEIIDKIDLSSDYSSDLNGDNYVDSLVIITDFTAQSDWGNILWPHMGNSRSFTDNLINYYYYEEENKQEYQSLPLLKLGKGYLSAYNIISASSITSKVAGDYNKVILNDDKNLYNVGVLAHEMLHTLGLADYYSYEDFSYQSVGEFDVMGSYSVIPQNMLGYLRYKMGWLGYDDLLYINDSGSYSLPLTYSEEGKTVAKIVLSDYHETGEYFMLEFRSKSLATAKDPFDNELSGDGLIVYRVNQASAYYNSAGELANTDYGNMYGSDEVYVYRIGNPKNTKPLNSPLGQSYALLGGNQAVYTFDGGKYDMTTYGNADKTKTADTLLSSTKEDSETALLYSNGKNSGIVISNVSVDLKNECVNFSVSLPEKQSAMPILTGKTIKISRFLNGDNYLIWNSDVKSGKAHVLVLRSTDRLKRLAEKGTSGITIENFKDATFKHYQTLYSSTVPLAEKCAYLPEFSDEALVFIAIESQNGSCAVRYVDCIENLNPTFGQYLYVKIDSIYYTYFAIGVIFLILVVVALYYRARAKRKK